MIAVCVSERYSAYHAPIVAESKMTPDQTGLMRQCGLRDRAEAERLGRQHEVADIGAAVDRTIDAQRLIGMDDGDMRRAEEIEIL